MTRQMVRISLAIMTTLLGLAILWQFRSIVIYVLISVTLAATLRPLVTRLVGRNLFERIGWVLVYLIGAVVIGYLLYLLGKAAVFEIQELANAIAEQDEWNLPAWLEGSLFQQMLSANLQPPSTLFQAATIGQAQLIIPALVGFTQDIAGVFSAIFVIIILSLYWIVSKSHFERLFLSMLPSGQRKRARDIWQTIEPDLGAYIRSQAIVNVVSGLLLGLGYWLIGSPYPTLLALIGAFVCAIPYVGVVLAVIIPFIVGVLTGGELALYLVPYTLLVVIGMGIWVKPRLFDRRWDNPILTMLLLVALADAFGLIGIIAAPPLAAAIQIFWNLLVADRLPGAGVSHVADIKERQARLWDTIRGMEEPPPPQVSSTMERLSRLIDKAEPILEAARQADAAAALTRLPQASQEQDYA